MTNKFKIQYTAPTQEERRQIEKIRNEYLAKDEFTLKLKRIKKLDFLIRIFPKLFIFGLIFIGILLFGLGLTYVLEWSQPKVGSLIIGISFAEIIGSCFLFVFIKNWLEKRSRQELLELSSSLLNEKN